MNQKHPIQTSHLILLTHFCIIFKSIWGSTVSTMTRIYTGRSGVKNLAEARELSLLHNIQTISNAHNASKSMKNTTFSLTVKWPKQTTTIFCLEPSLQISEAIPPFNLSPPWHVVGQLYFTLTSYLCIYLSRGRTISGLIKEPFIHYLPHTCTLYYPFIPSYLIRLH